MKKITFFGDKIFSPKGKLFIHFKHHTTEVSEVLWCISETEGRKKCPELETLASQFESPTLPIHESGHVI